MARLTPQEPGKTPDELLKEALKVQEKLKKLLEDVSELLERTKKITKDLGSRSPPPPRKAP